MTTNLSKTPVKLLLVLVYICCLSLLLGLGAWQLFRGLEKSRVEQTVSATQDKIVRISRSPKNWFALNYNRVELEGTWLVDKFFLLDNRVYQGQVGFELLMPFLLIDDNAVVLINRGWRQKSGKTKSDFTFSKSVASVKIYGQFYFPEKGFTLGPAMVDQVNWPKIIQYIDLQVLSAEIEYGTAPAIMVLDTDSANNLTRIWTPYVVNAVRHYGYAAQWWALALVLIIFGFIWSRKHEH